MTSSDENSDKIGDNDTKDELFSHAIRNFHDKYFDVLMLNYFGGFFESNRYHNWYNGLSKIDIPYFSSTLRDFMYYDVDTYATFGFIQTKYFSYFGEGQWSTN